MACPGGCIGGGGQPKSEDPLVLLKHMGAGGWRGGGAVGWVTGGVRCRCPAASCGAAACRAPFARPTGPSPPVYSIDERSAIRKSHENPSIQKLVGAMRAGCPRRQHSSPCAARRLSRLARPAGPLPGSSARPPHPAPPPPLRQYKEFLGQPNGPLAHELLHTT